MLYQQACLHSWCDPLDVTFAEVRRVLKAGGFSRSVRLVRTREGSRRAVSWAESRRITTTVNQFVDMQRLSERRSFALGSWGSPCRLSIRIQLTYRTRWRCDDVERFEARLAQTM